jgi:hypothetical protein
MPGAGSPIHTGRRERVLRVAVGLSLCCAFGFLIKTDYAWTMA